MAEHSSRPSTPCRATAFVDTRDLIPAGHKRYPAPVSDSARGCSAGDESDHLPMKPLHVFLAIAVAAVWGVNFVFIRIGLDNFPPLLLAALRFVVAAVPVLFLPRPNLPFGRFLLIAATLFFGQFVLLFEGMAHGMSPGLASVTLQTQVFLTMFIAALVLRERPTLRQILGAILAFAGIVAIATTSGDVHLTTTGLVLCLAAALSWAIGNVALRSAGQVDMLAMVGWLSLYQIVPFVLVSLVAEGPTAIGRALANANGSGIGAVVYLGLVSTVFGYGLWAQLLKLYSAATVAPFALLVPIFGASSAAIFLGEEFGMVRLIGMALVVAGLAIVVLPREFLRRRAGV